MASGLFLVQFSAAFPLRLLPIVAPTAFVAAGMNPASVGYFASIAALGALVGAVALPWLQARIGTLATLALCMAGAALAAISIRGGTFILFALGSFLAGLADGPTPAAGSAELQRAAPARYRTRLFSFKMLGGPLGGMSAGLLFPLAVSYYSWQAACWLASGVAVLTIVYFLATHRSWRISPNAQPAATTSRLTLQGLKDVLSSPQTRRLAVVGVVMAFVQGAWYAYFVTFLVTEVGVSLTFAGAMLSIALIGLVLSRVLLSILADVLGRGDIILAFLCLATALPWLALLRLDPASTPFQIIIVSIMFGATVGGWVGLQHAELARIMPNALILTAASLMAFLMFLGLTLSGVVFALALDVSGGYGFGFVSLAIMSALAGVFQLLRPLSSDVGTNQA